MKKEKTFKDRVLECIGSQKPTTWGLSIGLNTGVITRLFTYGKVPTWRHLITISNALNKSIDWLLTGMEFKDVAGKKGEGHLKVAEEVLEGYPETLAEEERHIYKLVSILRGKNGPVKEMIICLLDTIISDKEWIKAGKPERRKKLSPTYKGRYERRRRIHSY